MIVIALMRSWSGFGEWLQLLCGWWGGDKADHEEAEQRGDEGREDGVAVADDGRKGVVDEGSIPEEGDDGAGGNAGNGSSGSCSAPEEGGQDNRRESGTVDGVSVEGFLKDRLDMEGLVERPETKQDDHETADGEDLFVGCLWGDVADIDVVDEVGRGGEEPVVGGGDDLGEDGSHEKRAEEPERAGAGEAVEAGVGEDFAGPGMDFAGGKEDGTSDGDGDDDGLEDDGADDPANNGAGGVLFGFGGEELLVHGLIA